MQSTSHKYHAWRPGHERSDLHKFYPTINDLKYETEEAYNEFNQTVVQNEQFKTSNSTVYKGQQLPQKEFVELQNYKKAPLHRYVTYVNDNELSKIKFPETGIDQDRLKRSVTQQAYRHPKDSSQFPTFSEIISAPKSGTGVAREINNRVERPPFAGSSVTKVDFNLKRKDVNMCGQTLSEPITRHNLPPARRLTSLAPVTHKSYRRGLKITLKFLCLNLTYISITSKN